VVNRVKMWLYIPGMAYAPLAGTVIHMPDVIPYCSATHPKIT
jgi:hypothetical protein